MTSSPSSPARGHQSSPNLRTRARIHPLPLEFAASLHCACAPFERQFFLGGCFGFRGSIAVELIIADTSADEVTAWPPSNRSLPRPPPMRSLPTPPSIRSFPSLPESRSLPVHRGSHRFADYRRSSLCLRHHRVGLFVEPSRESRSCRHLRGFRYMDMANGAIGKLKQRFVDSYPQ